MNAVLELRLALTKKIGHLKITQDLHFEACQYVQYLCKVERDIKLEIEDLERALGILGGSVEALSAAEMNRIHATGSL